MTPATTSESQRTSSNGPLAAALAVGTLAVLMVGVQPILLGELVEARQVSLEGVGLVAMSEIVTLGLGVVLGDALLSPARLRLATIVAALAAIALDALTLLARGDGPFIAVRGAAGLAEGVLVWTTTAVIVRSARPDRVGAIFYLAQTLAQAAFGALLANVVIAQGGWKAGFAALGTVCLMALPLAFAQPARLAPLAPAAATGFRWSVATMLPLGVVFLQLAALGSFWAYLEPLGKAAGLSAQASQTLIAAVLALQVLGGAAATWAVRRTPVLAMLALASAVLAAATLAIHGLGTGRTTVFIGLCAVFGFFWLFQLPFQIGLAFRADPSGRVGTLVPALQLLGSAFGPLTASFVVDGDQAGAVPLLSTAYSIAALALIGASARRARAQS